MQSEEMKQNDATHTDINTAQSAPVAEQAAASAPEQPMATGAVEGWQSLAIEADVTSAVEPQPADADIKISIIVPIYTAEAFLRPAMDSILDQSLREIEVICVDDGSTDGSLKIIKDYQKQDSRIRIATQNNAGPGMARNTGLRRARGE